MNIQTQNRSRDYGLPDRAAALDKKACPPQRPFVMFSALESTDLGAKPVRVVRDRDLEGFDVTKLHHGAGGQYYEVFNRTHIFRGSRIVVGMDGVRRLILAA